ncbi:MAG: helix-turn-helix domain-containing protein [Ilumatobacteraceae bacterium]
MKGKMLVALEDVEIHRPEEFGGEVELQLGLPAVRSWPTRMCQGLEISLLIGPSHSTQIQGRQTDTPGKTTFVQLPGTVWSADEVSGAFLSVDIGPALFGRLAAEWPGRSALPGPSLVALPSLMDLFWFSHEVLRSQADRTARSEVLLRLVKTVLTHLIGAQSYTLPSADAIARVRDAIHDCPAAAPTIDELAQLAGLGCFELAIKFRNRYGLTPARYRLALRVALARRMLATGRSVDETVAVLGFGSAGALRRAFSSVVGVTPERYAMASA